MNTSSTVRSRAFSAENPTGAAGRGGAAEGPLGVGRKGRASVPLAAGETVTLAEAEGPGVIRHIWLTVRTGTAAGPYLLRDLVLRMYWEGCPTPSVEVPLGDFFCNGFGARAVVVSEPIVVAPTGGMNCYFPMPFRRHARITLTNEHDGPVSSLFYQVDLTQGDELDPAAGLFHARWSRTLRAPLGTDHPVLELGEGPGTYVGTYVALAALGRFWWGEGELKFFIDDDQELPTICGTGLEDYIGGAWAFQDTLEAGADPEVRTFCAPYSGYPFRATRDTTGWSAFATDMPPAHGMYRWHLPDPIHFASRLRVTLQQIGHDGHRLFERSDDVSSTAYWYQSTPAAVRPRLPAAADRHPV